MIISSLTLRGVPFWSTPPSVLVILGSVRGTAFTWVVLTALASLCPLTGSPGTLSVSVGLVALPVAVTVRTSSLAVSGELATTSGWFWVSTLLSLSPVLPNWTAISAPSAAPLSTVTPTRTMMEASSAMLGTIPSVGRSSKLAPPSVLYWTELTVKLSVVPA